jgi:hypothetical protein
LPSLGLAAAEGMFTLTWPGWATDWLLHSATNLVPPVEWTPVPGSATSNAGQWSVTVPVEGEARFFRLQY